MRYSGKCLEYRVALVFCVAENINGMVYQGLIGYNLSESWDLMKKNKFLCICFAFIMLLTGCKGGGLVTEKDAKRKPSTGDRWTVMIYMCASELEEKYGRASEVLSSLSYDLPENVNVIVETGGCKKWNSDEIKNDRIQDFAVQKDGLKSIYETLLNNMGSAETYKAFLSRTIEKYPADHYISVIWGDGAGAVSGAGCDATFEYDPLTIEEISNAIASVGTKFDIVGFDASLMSSIDTVAALSVYADYLVASQSVMPISGWNYRELFGYISENPQTSCEKIGRVICDGVKNYADDNWKRQVSMSLVDLSKATQHVQAFDTMARNMSLAVTDTEVLCRLKKELSMVNRMGANALWEGASNLADMVSLSNAVFYVTRDDRARLENIVSKAIPYTVSGDIYDNACGINVYYPFDYDIAEINKYKDICASEGYMEYIDSICASDYIADRRVDYKELVGWQYYSSTVENNQMSAKSDMNGKYVLSVTNPEIIALASVNIYRYDEEQGRYAHIMTDYDTLYSPELKGYEYVFSNTQLKLNGIPVSSYTVYKNDVYTIYSIPVIYDKKIYSLRVLKTEKDDMAEFEVMGLWSGINPTTGVIARSIKNVGVGDVIEPIYRVYGTQTDEYIKGKRLKIVFGGLNVSERPVEDGEYIVSYTTEDAYGVRTETETTDVTALKGKLKISN